MNPKYIFLLIFLTGCTNPEKKDILKISPEYFIDQNILLSDIACEIEYIPLSSEVYVPSVLSPQITDSLIIFSGRQFAGIFEFNRNGSFVRKIGRNGRGPGEYKYGNHFAIDNKNQRIYIRDMNKLLVYDFNGNFIKERIINRSELSRIKYGNNKLYLFAELSNSKYSNPSYNWIIVDTLGNELSSKKNSTTGFPESMSAFGISSNVSYGYNNKIYYWNQYNDTIFELQDIKYKTAYLFKQDEYRLTPEISGDEENHGFNKHYIVQNLFESQYYIFILYRQYRKTHFCLYDKKEKVFKNYTFQENKEIGLINDIDAGLPFQIREMETVENKEYLVGSINPYELKTYVKSDNFKNKIPKYPEKKKELEKLANSLNENDNPVLMLVELKK